MNDHADTVNRQVALLREWQRSDISTNEYAAESPYNLALDAAIAALEAGRSGEAGPIYCSACDAMTVQDGNVARSFGWTLESDLWKCPKHAAAPQQPPPVGVLTYKNQPDNVGAWRLGEACRHAKAGGDPIDHGLSLLQQLQERGYGVVPLSQQEAAPSVSGKCAHEWAPDKDADGWSYCPKCACSRQNGALHDMPAPVSEGPNGDNTPADPLETDMAYWRQMSDRRDGP